VGKDMDIPITMVVFIFSSACRRTLSRLTEANVGSEERLLLDLIGRVVVWRMPERWIGPLGPKVVTHGTTIRTVGFRCVPRIPRSLEWKERRRSWSTIEMCFGEWALG
jgi:hypothetical protein